MSTWMMGRGSLLRLALTIGGGSSRKIGSIGRSEYGHLDKFKRLRSGEEEAILDHAYRQIPQFGFTRDNLNNACQALGYNALTHAALFPRGEVDLVDYHLDRARDHLRETVLAPTEAKENLPSPPLRSDWLKLGTVEKIREGCRIRLAFNAPLVGRLDQALAILARPVNLSSSLTQLGLLVDDLWYLAGDQSSEFDWYTKRATLAMIYSASEIFMIQDTSTDFRQTFNFLDRRLEQLQSSIRTSSDILEFVSVNFKGLANTIRSKTG